MKALILFSTRDGQTRDIAAYIANIVREKQECDVINILHITSVEWEKYDRVLIGASIRYGHFHPQVARAVKTYLPQLQQRRSGFYSVNLTARKAGKNTPKTNVYTRKFLLDTPWEPECCAVFAGALRYPRYIFFDRVMIQLIMRITGGETDKTKEFEFTDWNQVGRFSHEFIELGCNS
ncbi:MAG: Protoporphyrinogen IX dehydrogenase [menaquinone] [Candidatus Erwinia impunctatus]|nr:Protoporphyrinogen IX dehydrogenase [menaquinone] [Culicoides impunctatus]